MTALMDEGVKDERGAWAVWADEDCLRAEERREVLARLPGVRFEVTAEVAEQSLAGICTVQYGVAETGSLVSDSSAVGRRLVSTLPPLHVALLPVDRIVQSMADALARFDPRKCSYLAAITGLDDLTTYYLLHRHDFGLDEAPAGAAILYAISCNLSDRDLSDRYRLLEQKGSTLQLLPWHKRASVGYDPVLDAAESQGAETPRLPGLEAPEAVLLELPLIDQAHRLMHLWRAGDVTKVDAYLDARGLRRNALFHQLLQALIELASAGSEERALLESISNYLGVRGERLTKLF